MKIVLDSVVETHHYQRRIRLKQGPQIKAKGEKFHVKEIVMIWPEGGDYEQVVCRGKAGGVWHRKAYSRDKMPNWLKAVVEGA